MEPRPDETKREIEVAATLEESARAQDDAGRVIDDVVRRLERLKGDLRRQREAERKKHPWRAHELIDPR